MSNAQIGRVTERAKRWCATTLHMMRAGVKQDGRTSIRCVYDSGLTGAALELGKNEICKSFTFSCIGRVERVECLDVALVDFLDIPAKLGHKKKANVAQIRVPHHQKTPETVLPRRHRRRHPVVLNHESVVV